MTSIKIKFRPSSVEGKEGSIHFLIIHNREVSLLNTDYRIIASNCFIHDALIASAMLDFGFLCQDVRYRAPRVLRVDKLKT